MDEEKNKIASVLYEPNTGTIIVEKFVNEKLVTKLYTKVEIHSWYYSQAVFSTSNKLSFTGKDADADADGERTNVFLIW